MDYTVDGPEAAEDGVHDLHPGRSRAIRPEEIQKGETGKICDRMNTENRTKK